MVTIIIKLWEKEIHRRTSPMWVKWTGPRSKTMALLEGGVIAFSNTQWCRGFPLAYAYTPKPSGSNTAAKLPMLVNAKQAYCGVLTAMTHTWTRTVGGQQDPIRKMEWSVSPQKTKAACAQSFLKEICSGG